MDHSKPGSQQQEQVSTQPGTTADTLEGQEGATAAAPTGPEVTSWGEGQFGPLVPLPTPLTTFESTSRTGATALAPGQRRIQPQVVVQPQAQKQGVLQLSPLEWPMPGEFYPRNRRQYSQESKSPPQEQHSVTELPGTVQGDDNDCPIQCTEIDSSLQPEQHIEVNSDSATQEIIHDGEASGIQEVTPDVKLSTENEVTSDACSQKEESVEDDSLKEDTQTVACCSQSVLCAEPINPCPQPSSSDQGVEDTASSGRSTPTLVPDDCRSDPGSSSESATTVLAAESELPQIDLSAGGIFRPTKSVIAPDHWGTHSYPSSVDFCHVPYENFIGCVPNMAPPNNFPPSPPTQETASVQDQYTPSFLPMIAKKGLFLRHDPPYGNSYPDVHNNPPVYAVRPPYYVHAAQQSQMNYIPVPPNQQWQTAQQWEQMMQSQQAVSQQDLSVLQQQIMMQGPEWVFMHQVPDTDHFPIPQQIHPMAQQLHYPPITQQQHFPSVLHQTQMSQRGVFMNQVPVTERVTVPQEHTPVPRQSHAVRLPRGPPVTRQSYTMQYPRLSTHLGVQNSTRAMAPQQYPPLVSHPRLHLEQQQQQLPPKKYEETSSQLSQASHQNQPASQQQQQQQQQVPVNYKITDTTPQSTATQSQQGLMQQRPPVTQHLPVPQHCLPAEDQRNHAADQELPSNMTVAEHQNVIPTPKISPEIEERQAGVEETQGLERPAHPRRPWVTEVEAAMIHKQATVRSAQPVLSFIPPNIPLQPDFSRPPPPIEYLATALGVDPSKPPQEHRASDPSKPPQQHRASEPSKPPQQHRANGAQWPEQYQVPPRLLNTQNGNKQWTNPPPLGIPSRRGRGGSYITNIGQPIRGRGARFPGRSDGESVHRFSNFQNQHSHMNGQHSHVNDQHSHMNGHGPGSITHSQTSRNDTVPGTSINCTPVEEQQKNNSKDSQKEHCNSELACQEEQNTNRSRSNMDQHNSNGRNNHRGNYIPFRHGHRPYRGAYPGRNTYHQRRDIRPTEMTDNTKANQPNTTSNHGT